MHDIEPHYNWRDYYIAAEDELSPFYGRINSEFEFEYAVYDHLIHPQWDCFDSNTLYMKILYTDYAIGYVIIELIGEWNDLLHNDIMYLKRNIVEHLQQHGIDKFILIGENVLNYYAAEEDDYYQEWFDEIENGWIVGMNFQDHVIKEFESANIDYYITFGEPFLDFPWRTHKPQQLFQKIHQIISRRLNAPI